MNISIKDFLELIDYSIDDSYQYQWNCFGNSALCISSNCDAYSIEIIFDTKNKTVYQMVALDLLKNKAYRMIHPSYKQAYFDEAKERGVDAFNVWENDDSDCEESSNSWVKYTDLDVEDDILEKAKAIFLGEEYDERVIIPLDFPKDKLFILMKSAHEQDITLNQYLNNIILNELKINNFM